MTLWFATGNTHKKKELSEILETHLGSGGAGFASGVLRSGWELKIPADAGLVFDPDETGESFYENALIKARALYRLLSDKNILRPGDAVIADDSGLCVDALGGSPGIFSARYAGAGVPSGNAKLDSSRRNELLLEEAGNSERRNARFVCAMILLFGEDRFYLAHETFEGELVKSIDSQRGKGGFGYDPILYIPEAGKTVAELSDAEKNRISHRGKAGKTIAGILRNL